MIDSASVVAAGSQLLGRGLRLVRVLTGGQHAVAVLVTDGAQSLVVRAFPRADTAVEREVLVLDRIASLGSLVPRLITHGHYGEHPIIVTSALPGTVPGTDVALDRIAEQLAWALATIHALDGAGLPNLPLTPPSAATPLGVRAQEQWRHVELGDTVLTHFDFWCGNALWDNAQLVGVIDWSSAGRAPRGVDLAWCRQDLVLLGSPSAADRFLREYEGHTGRSVPDIRAWDLRAAVKADPDVETWAENYRGINRPNMTPSRLRQRFDEWAETLVAPAR